jgi:GAF domain-containing protein
MDSSSSSQFLAKLASYGGSGGGDGVPTEMPLGAGLVGQCALEKRSILLKDIPPDYVRVRSGLGEAAPRSLIVLPVLFEGHTKAVIELASLFDFTSTHLTFLAQLTESIGIVLNTIEATMRTEGLLQQSQKLASELQTQQADQRRAGDQGTAARRPERRSRAQKSRNRASQVCTRGEGRGTGASV